MTFSAELEMWIRVKSNKDDIAMLVSLDQVTHIGARSGGGSTIYFAMDATDPTGREAKQRTLAVRDTIEDIADQIEFTRAPVSSSWAA